MNIWIKGAMRLWLIDDGERHWYSAYSKEDAFEQYCEPLRGKDGELWLPCDQEEITVEEVAGDTIVSVVMVDDIGQPTVRKTAAQWAMDGRGMVASSVY